jgi:nitrous oxide reductase accessory protein NosL
MQVSITHNGIPMKTCCMACALTYQAQTRNVEIQTATDFATDSPIDPRKAVWVVGSGISPCTQDVKVQKFIREPHAALHACYDRCEPGMLAFSKKSDAEKYQAENGGHLVEFDQLPSWLPVKGGQSHD